MLLEAMRSLNGLREAMLGEQGESESSPCSVPPSDENHGRAWSRPDRAYEASSSSYWMSASSRRFIASNEWASPSCESRRFDSQLRSAILQ